MRIPKVEYICAQSKVLLGLSEIGCSSSLTYSFYKTTQQEKPFYSWVHIAIVDTHTVVILLFCLPIGQCKMEDVNWMLCNVAHGES